MTKIKPETNTHTAHRRQRLTACLNQTRQTTDWLHCTSTGKPTQHRQAGTETDRNIQAWTAKGRCTLYTTRTARLNVYRIHTHPSARPHSHILSCAWQTGANTEDKVMRAHLGCDEGPAAADGISLSDMAVARRPTHTPLAGVQFLAVASTALISSCRFFCRRLFRSECFALATRPHLPPLRKMGSG
mmetsp:Transcript_36089/g.90025  ORF Transcript_36089/g.90025 Transcript_36089/m.90025 type:complete len:187 (-) Transcript_36089:225-785(-)